MNKLLWGPTRERANGTNLLRYMAFLQKNYEVNVTSYQELYDWSILEIDTFWESIWRFVEVRFSRGYTSVIQQKDDMLQEKWFENAELNFAENLLRFRDERTALVFKGESRESVRMTYAELYREVARLAAALRRAGVTRHDRVVGFMPNLMQTVIAMLATASLGATWSSCSPDFGIKGVLDRFGQIAPKVLFTADGYFYNGKAIDSLAHVGALVQQIPSIERVVVVPYVSRQSAIPGIPRAVYYEEFLAAEQVDTIDFEQVPSDHPLYIMYSSGTTGLPKCIVHGTAGILVNHLKELQLHTDVRRDDTIFYYTTCGWMMWNWLISSLALGATVVLYDGSPFHPDAGALWQLAQEEGVTIFGTSAKYLATLEKAGKKPGRDYDLSSLRTILSTGSPLSEESFEYVYREIKADVQLSSISGGTDLIGCFALGNPLGPVYKGELQCRGLGLKVEAYDAHGHSVVNQEGELVCTAPFPCQPLYFWNDPDKEQYRRAYFEKYRQVWCHGDYIKITDTGGLIIYGRSDATLNPGGVRIGTAEIYGVIEGMEEVADSLVVGQEWDHDIRVILFVKLAEGYQLTDALVDSIKHAIRHNSSPRHVPAKVIAIDAIPYTINMKKVELAVRNVIHGRPVVNKEALANPQALELYKDLPQLRS